MSAADLIAQARATVAEEHGWSAVELAERGGKLMYWIEQLCIELEDAADPAGAALRMRVRLDKARERLAADTAKLAVLRDDPHTAAGDGPDQSLALQ